MILKIKISCLCIKMVFKRRFVRRRRVGAVKRMAKGKTSRLQTLAKAVRTLQKKARSEADYLNMSQNVSNVNLNSTSPFVHKLTFYTGMTPVFGSASDDFEANKIIHKSVGMDCRVTLENTINNEESTIGFTAFLVSLKDAIGPYFTPGNGDIIWQNDVTHSIQNGMVLLNKKMFNIHKYKRFHLTNYDSALNIAAAQSQYGTDRRWYWKCPINKMVVNPAGNWRTLASANDPSKSYFMVIFNDNSSADLESPNVSITAVHTFKTVA